MSKVAIQGNASGTGAFTIAAPNSNTDRTLTLPDEAGTVLTSASSIPSSQITGSLGITMADLWRMTTSSGAGTSLSPITTWEQASSENENGQIGSSMTVASGVFTFPETGIYLIVFMGDNQVERDTTNSVTTLVSSDGGSNYTQLSVAVGRHTNDASGGDSRFTISSQLILDVTNTTNIKIKFDYNSSTSSSLLGSTSYNETSVSFIRLGDT